MLKPDLCFCRILFSEEDCMVLPGIQIEDLEKMFPKVVTFEVQSKKNYLRMVPQPEEKN